MHLVGCLLLALVGLATAKQHRYFMDHEPCYIPAIDKDFSEHV